ncbi:MAG: Capsular polysaccharide synthesis enzyme Cap8C Manganese-dependent protein-tyrosine phosphatase [uncultured Sulfurovum sp.]|uniref:protein-tyrosine-phosphatase n=1 Tax=uncultured Sulfurovum sp. TaxID=269237 RepID=A0A6S6UEM3_9BACT|nr:MAG: Capsular polysaccharide synthesis enzyme Cap8C Manganese-dependent protein-tyrosine phosphatase [uncultured Sulfurovum sp.]
MFLSSLFKKQPYQAVNNPFKVDIHSHLLPGIDDGAQTLKESLSLIKKFHLLGYTKLITTPHIISDYYPNNREIITEKLETVKKALVTENINITLEASAEYYVDMSFLNLIEEENLLTFMNHYVLFETDYMSKPIILEEVIRTLLLKGYIPVLAHPERYAYLHNDMENYKRLKALGVLFQVNAKSLYTNSQISSKIAKKLMKLGLVDFIGSDAHRMRDINRLESFLRSSTCQKMIKLNTIKNNF